MEPERGGWGGGEMMAAAERAGVGGGGVGVVQARRGGCGVALAVAVNHLRVAKLELRLNVPHVRPEIKKMRWKQLC